jgi:hypothetical protein
VRHPFPPQYGLPDLSNSAEFFDLAGDFNHYLLLYEAKENYLQEREMCLLQALAKMRHTRSAIVKMTVFRSSCPM